MAGGRDEFLERLFKLDKDNISNKQLEKLKSILGRDDCQPAALEKTSSLCSKLWFMASSNRRICNTTAKSSLIA